MSDIHLTRDLLEASSRGEITHHEMLQIALQHLSRHCPHCQEEILAWQRQRRGSTPQHLLDAVAFLLRREAPEAVVERRRTIKARLRELLAMPRKDREQRVSDHPEAYGSPHLAWLLLQVSRSKIASETVEAESLAALAMSVLWQAPLADDGSRELLARAHGYSAACCHRRGEHRLAEESFRAARYQVLHHGLTDSLLLAELDSLEAALRHDQRRLPAAVILLQRSALLYRLGGRPQKAARALLQLSTVHSETFHLSKAIDTTREALAHLVQRRPSSLLARGRHYLAWYLCDAGSFVEAEQVALENAGIEIPEDDRQTRSRQMWLLGRIAAGRGRPGDAERALRIAQNGFLRNGSPQNAALVALDLAQLYLGQGREDEARGLAEALPAHFGGYGRHPELLSAMLWLQRSARAGRVSANHLRRLQRLLRRVLGVSMYWHMT
jgi:tetratricopeptide (TPR) repeat protein